jgi:aminoglycoside phosphotransferase (APT) family kinase protein
MCFFVFGYSIFDGVVLKADASIIGTPFYVMEMVEGRIFKNPALPELRYS